MKKKNGKEKNEGESIKYIKGNRKVKINIHLS